MLILGLICLAYVCWCHGQTMYEIGVSAGRLEEQRKRVFPGEARPRLRLVK